MRKRKLPCGRIEQTKYLSCRRKHKWYNSYWTMYVEQLCSGKRKVRWKKKCLVCGRTIALADRPCIKDTITF